MHSTSKDRGFTLIELLIVVAIIAILAAIAVPNFLEAQVRAKVSRIKNDMRSAATAMESYRIDFNRYPLISGQPALTTPVSYITTWPKSPFNEYRNPTVQRWEYIAPNYPTFIMTTEGAAINEDYWDPRYNPGFPNLAVCGSCNTRDFVLYATWGQSPRNVTFPAPNVISANRGKSFWSFKSTGTDELDTVRETNNNSSTYEVAIYDPTNGTVSWGDILMFGPGIGFP